MMLCQNFSPVDRGNLQISDYDHEDSYGWFEDIEASVFPQEKFSDDHFNAKSLQRAATLPSPLSYPPTYVLESTLSYQQLWYVTAGRRPKQPSFERMHFEKLWGENFAASEVQKDNIEDNTRSTMTSSPTSVIVEEVLFRGGSFSNAVSKSFIQQNFSSITLQLPRYRIVKNDKGNLRAEYLVVIYLGRISFGIWKRHSDFEKLFMKVRKVKEICEQPQKDGISNNLFMNTTLSWQCLLRRKRWFRCLDKEYLALKCFLLERFIHDLLLESTTPDLIMEFLE